MSKETLLAIVGGLAILNGLFNPVLVALVRPFLIIWFPGFMEMDAAVLTFLNAMLAATVAFVVTGVPAALVERGYGWRESQPLSLYVWLATACLISLPALPVLLRL